MSQTTAVQHSNNVHRSNGLVLCAITDRDENRNIQARIFANIVEIEQKLDVPGLAVPGGPGRGVITTFSRRSRNRLLRKVAKMRNLSGSYFVTLTYPDSVAFGSGFTSQRYKRDMSVFRKRLIRMFGNVGGLWRLEFQDRKSGPHRGRFAPHFHVIVTGITASDRDRLRSWCVEKAEQADDIDEAKRWRRLSRMGTGLMLRVWVQCAWYEIAHDGDENEGRAAVQVDIIANQRHAMWYASQYVGKVAGSAALLQYLEDDPPGRHWGTFGTLDMSESATIRISYEQFIQMRRILRQWVGKRSPDFARTMARMSRNVGFSLFGMGDESSIEYQTGRLRPAIMRLLEYA